MTEFVLLTVFSLKKRFFQCVASGYIQMQFELTVTVKRTKLLLIVSIFSTNIYCRC